MTKCKPNGPGTLTVRNMLAGKSFEEQFNIGLQKLSEYGTMTATETGWYYLQSRYYDPAVGRFISPDDVSLLGANGDLPSCNLYAYCSNNPVNFYDPTKLVFMI